MNNKIAIAIIGPTASGKTALSLALSSVLPSEIISADSRQIYRYLDIGTAKPTEAERACVRHHCIDICNPDEKYSAGLFAKEAKPIVNRLFDEHKVPIIVGGSGLYVHALCEGLAESAVEISEEMRQKAMDLYEQIGREELFAYVKSIDPLSAEKYSDKNPHRLLRVVEYYFATGLRFSDFHAQVIDKPSFTTLYFGLDYPRAALYEIINKRCEMMWDNGIFEETESVLNMGFTPDIQSLQTVGYKEVLKVLHGELTNKEGLEAMKQSTRRYAKRQLTWCNNQTKVQWLVKETAVQTIVKHYAQSVSAEYVEQRESAVSR
ncbi:MAG TPA: tRNA (adenosine(37)-N6)-dimethylallyltransferase MiaA [Candidatus Kapabacteria bacterium]|jgi:tRNA dimethylallyltransferase|nr:tRNA (adenosine(37)-N6)-dimethylallyltransferase MiaA [Candidatus Kapabacteria bacterium]